jgi:hypothetical protein
MTGLTRSHPLSDDPCPRFLPPAHLIGLAAASFLVLLCGVVELTGVAINLPPLISGTLGAALFASAPGFLLFSYLCLFQNHNYGGLTLFLVSVSLSFTSNFLFNVLTFAIKLGISEGYTYYFFLMFMADAAFIGLMIRRDRRFVWRLIDALRSQKRSLTLIVAGAIAVIVSVSLKSSPGLLVEETFILRKIAELPTIEMGNLSLMPNTPITYVFVPFYLFLGLVSRFSQIDVVGTIFAVGPYLTLVAFCLTLKLLLLISNDRRVVGCFSLVFLSLLISVPLRPGNYHTVIIPSIDRYGVAEGLLLPLAIFHYVMHSRDRRTNIAMLVGLIYLIVEVSFVHARETLCFLAFALAYLSVLAGIGRSWIEIRRGAFILGIVSAILAIYREVTLSQAAELLGFVKSMSSIMHQSLIEIIRSHDVAAFLGYKPPNVPVSTSPDIVETLARQGIFFPAVSFVLLPVYAALADNPLRLSMCLTATACMLFATMVGLQLAIGAVVGSWFILDIKSFVALLLFLVLVDFFVQALAFSEQLFRRFRSDQGLWIGSVAGAKALVTNPEGWGALVATSIYLSLLANWDGLPPASRTYAIVLLATVGLTWRIKRFRKKAISSEASAIEMDRQPVRFSWPVYGLLVTLVSFFSFWNLRFQPLDQAEVPVFNTPPWTWRMSCARSDFFQVFDCLNEYQLLHIVWYKTGVGSAHVPRELLQFFKRQVPVGKVVFGTETLPILMAAPVYSPVVTYSSVFLGNFVTNTTVVEKLLKGGPASNDGIDYLRIGSLLSSKKGQELIDEIIEGFKVDFIIIGPKEYAAATVALQAVATMRHRFRSVFDSADYLVLAVEASPRSDPISDLRDNKKIGQTLE